MHCRGVDGHSFLSRDVRPILHSMKPVNSSSETDWFYHYISTVVQLAIDGLSPQYLSHQMAASLPLPPTCYHPQLSAVICKTGWNEKTTIECKNTCLPVIRQSTAVRLRLLCNTCSKKRSVLVLPISDVITFSTISSINVQTLR